MRHALLFALILTAIPTAAQAGVRLGIGFNFGPPCYYGYGPYYRPYYYPPAVYVGPPPLVYAPAPVYLAPPPVVAVPAFVPAVAPAAPPPSVVRAARPTNDSGNLVALNDPAAKTRADGCIGLGRAKDPRAIGPLSRCLKEDDNPQVRDAAARALGLIGSPASLDALQRAAGNDADRDVRRSASFAAEIIRANMER
jgi:HEAT repeats